MPVDLPDPKTFKAALPRAPRLHGLFGTKNFRVHGFMEGDKWAPQALCEQYSNMVHMLETHKRYKLLEFQKESREQEVKFQELKEQCRGGRMLLKQAQAGDYLKIRTLISHSPTLLRLYSSMPLYAILKHSDDLTFVRRREKDRLLHEQKAVMEAYKNQLEEKARLEDRLKFEAEYKIPEELEIEYCRCELSTSETRIYALKAIQRAYKKMIKILGKDQNFYGPVLNSLQEDVAEQEKFIKLTVLLGYPVINEKLQSLEIEYRQIDYESRKIARENVVLVDNFKKKTAKENRTMIDTVRKFMARIGDKNSYVRETKSMVDLKVQVEELGKVIKELQMITTSGRPRDVYPRFKMTDMILNNEIKEQEFKERMYSIMLGATSPTKSKEMEEKFNFSADEIDRFNEIEALEKEVQKQKDLRKKEERYVIEAGKTLTLLKRSLYQMVDVLRHCENPLPVIEQKYPNKTLPLPLLDFEAKPMKAIPPVFHEENMEETMNFCLKKILKISHKLTRSKIPFESFPDYVREYRNRYFDMLSAEDEKKAEDINSEEEEIELEQPGILTRKQIKNQSTRIVEKIMEQRELTGLA